MKELKTKTIHNDEYDIEIAKDAYSEYIKEGRKSRPITEMWSELDI